MKQWVATKFKTRQVQGTFPPNLVVTLVVWCEGASKKLRRRIYFDMLEVIYCKQRSIATKLEFSEVSISYPSQQPIRMSLATSQHRNSNKIQRKIPLQLYRGHPRPRTRRPYAALYASGGLSIEQ